MPDIQPGPTAESSLVGTPTPSLGPEVRDLEIFVGGRGVVFETEPFVWNGTRLEYFGALVEHAKSWNKCIASKFNGERVLVAPSDSAIWAEYRFRSLNEFETSVEGENRYRLLNGRTFHRETGSVNPVEPRSEAPSGTGVQEAYSLKEFSITASGEEALWNREFIGVVQKYQFDTLPREQQGKALEKMQSLSPILKNGSPLLPLLPEVAQALVLGGKQFDSVPQVIFSNGTIENGPPKLQLNELQEWLDGAHKSSKKFFEGGCVVFAVFHDPRGNIDRLAAFQRTKDLMGPQNSLWKHVIQDRFLTEGDMAQINSGVVNKQGSNDYDLPLSVLDCSVRGDYYWSSIIGLTISEGPVPEELETLEDIGLQALRFAVESGSRERGPLGTALIKLPNTSVLITVDDSPRTVSEKIISALGEGADPDYIRAQFPYFRANQ